MRFVTVSNLTLLAGVSLASPINKIHHRHNSATASELPSNLQHLLKDSHDNPAYEYPTDFTQGIIPKAVHSHNDYWRKVPFFSALSVGAISIEADVWLVNGTLYVGHDRLSLSSTRTFDSLYVQPILETLQRQNPTGQIIAESSKYGVYDTTPTQTLYLWVDLKTNGAQTWPAVVQALEPLREAGFLTRYDGTSVIQGVVTVIGTGNTPLNLVQGVSPRDYFYDANLAELGSNGTLTNVTSEVSPIASTQFSTAIGSINGTQFSASQLATLRDQIETARQKGIGARYWDTPAWPLSKRNAVWRTLIDEGVALLNVDDLPAAAGYGGPAAW